MFKISTPRIATRASISAIVAVPVLAGLAAFLISGMMESKAAPVGKIGPGYARMQPVDLGKPDKIAYSTPYHSRVATPPVSRTNQPAPSMIAAPVKTPAPPMMIAEAPQSRYSRPDIHRVY
jgi:hypothetical protein